MEWILEHFQIVAVVAAVIAYWYNNLRKGDEVDPEEQQRREAAARESNERVRRIQEEIRRKILERQGGAGSGEVNAPPVAAARPNPPPVPRQPLRESEPSPWRIPAEEPVAPAPAMSRGEDVFAQLREAEARQKVTAASADAARSEARRSINALEKARLNRRLGGSRLRGGLGQPVVATTGMRSSAAQLRKDLIRPGSARRAILLSDILGPPKALQ